MHTVNLIASALRGKEGCPEITGNPQVGICCVTGDDCQTLPRKELLGKSFTNSDLLAAPESNRVGIDGYIALSYKWERMSCWFCDGKKFQRLKRTEFRPLVLNGVELEMWSAYITTSYKKHGALWTKVNKGQTGIWRFENQNVDCRDLGKVNEWYSRLNEALHAGIGRSILETLDCSAFVAGKIDIKNWIEFERWARPKYQSPLYQLLCYFLPSKEERKDEPSNENSGIQTEKQASLFPAEG